MKTLVIVNKISIDFMKSFLAAFHLMWPLLVSENCFIS